MNVLSSPSVWARDLAAIKMIADDRGVSALAMMRERVAKRKPAEVLDSTPGDDHVSSDGEDTPLHELKRRLMT